MDIISNKKSNLLYQRGDITNKGIIDLRQFSDEKKRKNILVENSNNTVREIVRREKNIESKKIDEKSDIKQENVLRNTDLSLKNSIDTSVIVSKKDSNVEVNNLERERHFKISPTVPVDEKHSLSKLENEEVENKQDFVASEKIEKAENFSSDYIDGTKPKINFSFLLSKSFASFVLVSFLISSFVFSLSFFQKEIEEKGRIMGVGVEAFDNLKQAGQSVADNEFDESFGAFEDAKLNFSEAKRLTDELGLGLAGVINSLPINTPLSTAKNVSEAGENIAIAGENIAKLLDEISRLDQNNFSSASISGFGIIIDEIAVNLREAENNISLINVAYVPDEMREKMKLVQKELPVVVDNLENLSEDFEVLTEIIGDNQPQKYLLLFQNNSEMRATGGFIGSYGILNMENGKVENMFIDGIFNPDGQLKEKIVPPMPIQKISASWSMHDANWFADFPTSAQKVASFYEKTGGSTVDGVISFTPNVIEKVLRITGPIRMDEYDMTIDSENFISMSQMQVEELYDKQENKPKKFLVDLMPVIFEKMFNNEGMSKQEKLQRYLDFINIVEESLKEKHIMFYHRDSEIENMILRRGWGGQMLNSSGNYLSVINSNINGYKTDVVVEESIDHLTEIQEDGSIINTVKITRVHTGGQSEYDWYNRVNSDYLRVYVPLGSVLLEASGHTVQEYVPPMDYDNFRIDEDVKLIEDTIKIDLDSGTQIFTESGKTVFGNWVYVSPGEKVEVTYKYKLPYKIDFNSFTKPADKYSMMVQKQSGSQGSGFSGTIKVPESWNILWESAGLITQDQKESYFKGKLETDKIYGIVFSRDLSGDE
ncbi:MAG: DUF4012 domain-containing protein [Candidatus Pacebacteria bacterium]|nr:DUF4012 domain-containing protein [Candidatus Paceibacterota bacterium]